MGGNSVPLTRTVKYTDFQTEGLKRTSVKGEDGKKIENVFTDSAGNVYKVVDNGDGTARLTKLTKERNGNLSHTARYSTREADEEAAQKNQLYARSGDATKIVDDSKDKPGFQSTPLEGSDNVKVVIPNVGQGQSEIIYNSKTMLLTQDTFIDDQGHEIHRNYENIEGLNGEVTGSKLVTGFYEVKDNVASNSSATHNLVYDYLGNVESDHVTGTENNIQVDYTNDFRGRVINDKAVGNAAFQNTRVPAELKSVLGEDFNYSLISEIDYQYYNNGDFNNKVSLAKIKMTDGTSREVKFGMIDTGYGVQSDKNFDEAGNQVEEPAPQFDPGNKSWYEIVTQDYGITGRDAIYQAIGQLKAANGVTNRRAAIGPKATIGDGGFNTPEITIGDKTYKINSAPAAVSEEPAPVENERIEVPAQITGDALPADKQPYPDFPDLKNLTTIPLNEENPRVVLNGREIQLNRIHPTPEGVVQFEVVGTNNQIYLRQNNGQTIISIEDNKKNLTSLFNSEGEYFGSVEDVYTGDPAEALIPDRKVYRGKDGNVVSFCELKQDESNRTADIYNADGTFRGRVVSPFDETKPVVYYDKDGNIVDPFEVEFQGIVVDRNSA